MIIKNFSKEKIIMFGYMYLGYYMVAQYDRIGEDHISFTSPTLDTDKKVCMTFWYNLVVSKNILN